MTTTNPPKWTHVVIHHSGTQDTDKADTATHRRYHTRVRRWRDLGYHFVVERVGDSYEVLAGRPLDMAGAHCPGMNRKGIGVCFVGDFTEEPPPEEQLRVGRRFLRGLMLTLDIPPEHLVAHRDYRPTECPGAAFQVQDLLYREGRPRAIDPGRPSKLSTPG
ncbi:MAG: peptidoglycan recognition family protein [Acidobacteriota bacterium]